jgi:hypothetical protein
VRRSIRKGKGLALAAGFGKIMAPLMASAMRRANEKDLKQLKRLLERG